MLRMTASAFLSYARQDAEEVRYLQQQLNVRGVRAWRDVTDLPLGGATEDQIIHAIEQIADAFVIYITRQALASHFIWNIEIPAALRRWEHDHIFNIVPILRGVTFDEMERHSAAHGLRSLKEFNGVPLPWRAGSATEEEFNSQLRLIARRILVATLNNRHQSRC